MLAGMQQVVVVRDKAMQEYRKDISSPIIRSRQRMDEIYPTWW